MPGWNRNARRRRGRHNNRKGNRKKKPSSRVRASLSRKPSALQALALKNAKMIKKLNQLATMRSTWQLTHLSSNVYEPFQSTQIIFPQAWTGVFNSDKRTNAGDAPARVRNVAWKGSYIDIRAVVQIEAQTQYVPISCCYLVYRPHKSIARQFESNTVNGSKLQEGVHYTAVSTGLINGTAMWHFNTEILDILYIKNFMVSEYAGEGTAGVATSDSHAVPFVGNIKDANRRIYCRIPYKKLIKTDNSFNDGNAAADREKSWTQLHDTDIAAEDKIYCCLFNNAPGIQVTPPEDQKLFWSQNVMFHGRSMSAPVN